MILGIGVDIVSVARMAKILDRSNGFVDRVYTDIELSQSAGRVDRLAARFAAKEAWLKAMGLSLFMVPLTDLSVENEADGRPRLSCFGAANDRMRQRGVRRAHLSLSHNDDQAVAMLVLEGDQ